MPVNCAPIAHPIGMDIKVDKEPTTAAPNPAICPIGSIASALKLPKRIPQQKKASSNHVMNSHRFGTPSVAKTTRRKMNDITVMDMSAR